MRIWLDKKYGIKVKPSPWHGIAGLFLAILPFAFTAALSVREDTDVRLLKYFLPYGKIKRFVKLAYGIQRSDVTQDRGLIGAIRAILPYGLVIWWDTEDTRPDEYGGGVEEVPDNAPLSEKSAGNDDGKNATEQKAAPVAITFFKEGTRIADADRLEFQRIDRIEAMISRLLILTAGRARNAISRVASVLSDKGHRERQRIDRIEAVLLRLIILMTGGGRNPFQRVDGDISDVKRRELLCFDRIEALTMRLLIMTGKGG